MRYLTFVFYLLLFPLSLYSYTDESHYSLTFGETRYFRVFTPPGYAAANCSKKYPVIYYFNGCGGSYRKSGTYSYADYGLTAPVAIGRKNDPEYEYPDNADFENFVNERDVIIVCVDGKIYNLPDACGVYFPSMAKNWSGNFYNFSAYIRELIDVVDSRYNTKRGPEYRAVSGLSMGGQEAIWVAAANPHLFSSASEFCHSPRYYDVGEPSYMTTIDVNQLWRNLRGLPFRHSTNDRDYLKYYTKELSSLWSGAGFKNEFYLADFCKHHAARIDLQFDFHISHFSSQVSNIPCFSYINLYPHFEVRGYELSSSKTGNGWIYLHSVSKNGLGLYTRKYLPWGRALRNFPISLITPAIYEPDSFYTLSRYNYLNGTFATQEIKSDKQGRLTLSSSGGIGEEIGILGKELQPPVFVLTDTVNENIYLDNNAETALSFDVVNLSESEQTVDFIASTENIDLLSIHKSISRVTIPAGSKVKIDSMFVCRGVYLSDYRNTGYIKISSTINGIQQERDHIIQVTVKNNILKDDTVRVKIFEGRSESLAFFKYEWGDWNKPLTSGVISEGIGNGNGKVDADETFSIWIQPSSALDPNDLKTWHPVIPVNAGGNKDITVEEIKQHNFNTGRTVLSAVIRLNRKPAAGNPVIIPVQAEFLKIEPLMNACHRDFADNFGFFFYDIIIYEDGIALCKK